MDLDPQSAEESQRVQEEAIRGVPYSMAVAGRALMISTLLIQISPEVELLLLSTIWGYMEVP